MLDRLSKAGVRYLFVSNSDNLGATLDVSLLSYFAQSDKAFIMEVRLFAESDTAFIMEVRLFAESDTAFIMEVRHSAAVTPGQEGVLVRIAMAMPPVGVCLRDLSRVRQDMQAWDVLIWFLQRQMQECTSEDAPGNTGF